MPMKEARPFRCDAGEYARDFIPPSSLAGTKKKKTKSLSGAAKRGVPAINVY